jgi:hypothetical protein
MHVHGHERAAAYFHVLSLPARTTVANLGRGNPAEGTPPGRHE